MTRPLTMTDLKKLSGVTLTLTDYEKIQRACKVPTYETEPSLYHTHGQGLLDECSVCFMGPAGSGC